MGLVAIVAIVIFSGCIEEETQTPALTPTVERETPVLAPTSALPTAGEWTAPVDFGEFMFIVNNSSTGISKITYHFSNWTCEYDLDYVKGKVTRSGRVSISPVEDWPITSGNFTIETEFHDKGKYAQPKPPMTFNISGKFDETGTHASGTWDVFLCRVSGTWSADCNSNENSNT